jgi:hypothetical protein
MMMQPDPPPAPARTPPLDAAVPRAFAPALAGPRVGETPVQDTRRIVHDGVSPVRLAALAGGLGLAVTAGYRTIVSQILMPFPGEHAMYGLLVCAATGALGILCAPLVRRRSEYLLTAREIERRVYYGRGPRPSVTPIAWEEIASFREIDHADGVRLDVESATGIRISLRSDARRRATREFIRRFVAEAERHPRAARPADLPEVTGGVVRNALVLLGSTAVFATLGRTTGIELSPAAKVAGAALAALVGWGFFFWLTLGDSDVALRDRTSSTLGARLRNRVRGWLGMRVV